MLILTADALLFTNQAALKVIEKRFLKTHRLARAKTILDIALKDDAIGLSESECLVNALQGCAVGGKSEISSDQNMKDFLHL